MSATLKIVTKPKKNLETGSPFDSTDFNTIKVS